MATPAISERDVRRMIRLVGDVACSRSGLDAKRRILMEGLSKLVGADNWAWAISPITGNGSQPAYTSFLHGGFDDDRLAQLMRALDHTGMKPLHERFRRELAGNGKHLTRTLKQLDPTLHSPKCEVGSLCKMADISEVLVSLRSIDGGFCSAVGFCRRNGGSSFSEAESRIAHVVLTEVPWLHEQGWSKDAAKVPTLSPRRRTVLNLVLEGMSRKAMASQLGISEHTLGGYVKDIFRHFGVHSQAELIARFRKGDGDNTPRSGD